MSSRTSSSPYLADLAAAAALLVAAAGLWSKGLGLAPPRADGLGSLWVVSALVALGTAAGLYRPASSRGLALGTMVLPSLLLQAGAAGAALGAAAAIGLRDLVLRWAPRTTLTLPGGRPPTARRTLRGAGGLALATLGAGWVWRVQPLETALAGGPDASLFARGAVLAGSLFALLRVIYRLLEARERTDSTLPLLQRGSLSGLALEIVGWGLGVMVLVVVPVFGWSIGLLLQFGATLLALDSARNAILRGRAESRLRALQGVTEVAHRIASSGSEMRRQAQQILEECAKIVPLQWFHLEILVGPEPSKSWRAGPEAVLEEGIPSPPPAPPALPGIHKRSDWKVVERELMAEGEVLARLRLWCDPRTLENRQLDLFDALIPQLAGSVHRAALDHAAKQDPLTGLPGRRVLQTHLFQAFDRACDEGRPMAVLMCDLDHFKGVNDRYGHAAGDQALLLVAQVLETHRRDSDLCCRFGGEEFVLVLEGADSATALTVAERLRHAVETSELEFEGQAIPLTVSVGLAVFPELYVASPEELLQLADEALYEAKRSGRNRCLENVGRGNFQTSGGTVLRGQRKPPEAEAPQIFA